MSPKERQSSGTETGPHILSLNNHAPSSFGPSRPRVLSSGLRLHTLGGPYLPWHCFLVTSSHRGKSSVPPALVRTRAVAVPWAVSLSLSWCRVRGGSEPELEGPAASLPLRQLPRPLARHLFPRSLTSYLRNGLLGAFPASSGCWRKYSVWESLYSTSKYWPSTCYKSAGHYFDSGSLQCGHSEPVSTAGELMVLSASCLLPRNCPRVRQTAAIHRGKRSCLVISSFFWVPLLLCQPPRAQKTETLCRKGAQACPW